MPGEVLSTFMRAGRTCAIVRVNELIVELVIEPDFDGANEPTGYHYWIRTNDTAHASEQAAIVAAMNDITRLSRIKHVAVVQLPGGDFLNGC